MAQQLWLLRHGEAEPHDARPDDERELTDRGRAQARAAGAALAALKVEVHLAFTSPKVRARDTAGNVSGLSNLATADPTGTPLRRSQPGSMLVVTTLSEPQRCPPPPAGPRSRKASKPCMIQSPSVDEPMPPLPRPWSSMAIVRVARTSPPLSAGR